MAKIYYKWINAGIITIDKVPDLWKKATQELIDQNQQNKEGRLTYYVQPSQYCYLYVIKVLKPSISPTKPWF